MRVRVVSLLVVVLMTSGGSCGQTARTVAKSGDDLARLGKAASVADDLGRFAAASTAAARVDNGLSAAANSIPVEGSSEQVARVKDALKTMAWQAFCDAATGELPENVDEVSSWISKNAWTFGLALTGDADLQLAGGVIDQIRAYPNSEPPTACERLPESGL